MFRFSKTWKKKVREDDSSPRLSNDSPNSESPMQGNHVSQPAITPSALVSTSLVPNSMPAVSSVLEGLYGPVPLNGPTTRSPGSLKDDWSNTQAIDDTLFLLTSQLKYVFRNKDIYKKLLHCEKLDAQTLLDSFQRLLDLRDLDPPFRNDLRVATQRLAKQSGLYPTCCKLEGVEQVGQDPVDKGGFADIYKAKFQGKLVCLKTIRLYQNSQVEHVLKKASKEAMLWRQLSHPNILTFIGVYRFQNKLSFVTEWMENGNIKMYLEQNPTAHRPSLASGVARGLSYLHENDVVHGDLKGPNILVDGAGRARVADFGISSISDPKVIEWTSQSSVSSKGGTTRWQAPELFAVWSGDDDDVVKNTVLSDIYALGCVFVEIFIGKVPFAFIKRTEMVLSIRITSSDVQPATRPPKTSQSWVEWGLSEEIWSCMEACWKAEPSERPTAAEVARRLATDHTKVSPQDSAASDLTIEFRRQTSKAFDIWATVAYLNRILGPIGEDLLKMQFIRNASVLLIPRLTSVFQNRVLYNKLLHCEQLDAQRFLDSFQQLLDVQDLNPHFRYKLTVAIQRLSARSGLYPACYILKDLKQLGEYPVNSEGYTDIYQAEFRGRVVCLRKIRHRFWAVQIRHDLETISNEAIMWRQLSHPNILTFIGLYRLRGDISIVTEWMQNGNVNDYLLSNPTANRPSLASGVARGVSYLHENDIVHGNLKGSNILVDNAGHACVADFGTFPVQVVDNVIVPLALEVHPSMLQPRNCVRWQAPELFAAWNNVEEVVKNTFASDIYALACVFVEIFTGNIPFASVNRDQTVMFRVMSGARPARPPKSSPSWTQWGLTEEIWSCMQDCWRTNPYERPSAAMVVQRMAANLTEDDGKESGTLSLPTEFRLHMSEPFDMGVIADLNRVLGTTVDELITVRLTGSSVGVSGRTESRRRVDQRERDLLEFDWYVI